jgi:hypothetical protein
VASSWWRGFGDDFEPFVLSAEENGQLIGLAPLMLAGWRLAAGTVASGISTGRRTSRCSRLICASRVGRACLRAPTSMVVAAAVVTFALGPRARLGGRRALGVDLGGRRGAPNGMRTTATAS